MGRVAREGTFLIEKSPPSRSLLKRRFGGDAGGEAASLREAPLPQTPSPEEWLGIGLCVPSDLCAHAACDRFPISLVVVAGDEPLRPPKAGTSPFRGGFAECVAERLPPQRELSAVRLTEGRLSFWRVCCRGGSVYLPPFAPRMVPLSAEGGEGWRRSRHKLLFRTFQARPKDGARLAALRSPFGNLRAPTYKQYQNQASAGRGGSVSRRDHNQATGNRVHLTGGTKLEETHNPNASCSSGEGVWGRGASLREAASPPEFHFPIAPLREGVRGRTLLYREAFSPAIVPLATLHSLLRR